MLRGWIEEGWLKLTHLSNKHNNKREKFHLFFHLFFVGFLPSLKRRMKKEKMATKITKCLSKNEERGAFTGGRRVAEEEEEEDDEVWSVGRNLPKCKSIASYQRKINKIKSTKSTKSNQSFQSTIFGKLVFFHLLGC